jgi:phage terminase large subunit-like protein
VEFGAEGVSSWLPIEKIQQNKNIQIDVSSLGKIRAVGAFDLSLTGDWSVFTICFSYKNKYSFIHKFYLPQETLSNRYKNENINIKEWINNGLITIVPGATVDYSYIYNDITAAYKKYNLTEVCFDPWKSSELIKKLETEVPELTLVPVEQSLKSFSPLTQKYEKAVLDGLIIENNPVLYWEFGNVVIKPDINGNYKPLKNYKSSTQRIDAVITEIMSFNRFVVNEDKAPAINFKNLLNSF